MIQNNKNNMSEITVPKDYNQVSVYYLIAFYSMPIVFNG
jgi:hypothetical protein